MARQSFWQRPEGKTGLVFLLLLLGGLGTLGYTFWGSLLPLLTTTVGLVASMAVLGTVLYAVLDPRTRALFGYLYQSAMRGLTGLFVTIDPIGVLENYIAELKGNLQEMRKQIGQLRGQVRHLQTLMATNNSEIEKQLQLAKLARETGKREQMILGSRRAARLKDSNAKYAALLDRMQILNRVLNRMHDNSEVLLEDTRDRVNLKIQERKAIRASHGAMASAMSVINGNPDQRARFDQAMESITDDVANKVGEMERMMELSSDFMNSVDVQNGVFADEGLRMLEEWERKSELLLDGGHLEPEEGLDLGADAGAGDKLDLDGPRAEPERRSGDSGYDAFFD